MKEFHNEEAKQDLSSTTRCLLSLLMSNYKNRMISLNLFLDRVLLNIRHPQELSHKLSNGKTFSPKIPLAIISPINLSNSLRVTSQFLPPKTRWASATVHFFILLSIASSNKTQKDDSGLLSMILLVAYEVGPGLKFSMFCCC